MAFFGEVEEVRSQLERVVDSDLRKSKPLFELVHYTALSSVMILCCFAAYNETKTDNYPMGWIALLAIVPFTALCLLRIISLKQAIVDLMLFNFYNKFGVNVRSSAKGVRYFVQFALIIFPGTVMYAGLGYLLTLIRKIGAGH